MHRPWSETGCTIWVKTGHLPATLGVIAIGEAAKAGDHIPVPAGKVSGAWIAELLEQRHQPELPPCLLGFSRQPAALHRMQAQHQGLGITVEGHAGVAPDLPRELIQQQHQRQSPGRVRAPGVELTGDGASGQPLANH